MSNADPSTNPQIDHSDTSQPLEPESDQKKMDRLADDMAGKAGRVQGKHESDINSGSGVSQGGGGIFSK